LDETIKLFSQNIAGFGTGLDERSHNIEDFIELYQRDLKQAPNPIHYQILSQNIHVPVNAIGIASCELNIQTHILDQEVKFNNLRLTIVFRNSQNQWLIEHMHISFPTEAHEDDESYPIKELEERNKVLKKLVDKRTKELNEAIREISVLATTDKLTGLFNRLKIEEYLENELQRTKRYNHQFSVILIDIDYFKNINDTYGHLVGDQVLVDFGEILKKRIRQTDIVGRWGGEEFLVVCPETSLNESTNLAESIRQAIENSKFNTIDKLTASFGIANYLENDTIDSIVKRADDALYQAKKNGRNRVACS